MEPVEHENYLLGGVDQKAKQWHRILTGSGVVPLAKSLTAMLLTRIIHPVSVFKLFRILFLVI